MSQVTPATSLRRCGSGERWLSIHIKSSESPIHMMPAMMWIQRSSRPSHSASTASMLLAASRRPEAAPTSGSPPVAPRLLHPPTRISVMEVGPACGGGEGFPRSRGARGNPEPPPLGYAQSCVLWQVWWNAAEYAVLLPRGSLGAGQGG